MQPIQKWALRFNQLLWVWVPLAIATGLLVPCVAHLEPFALLLLALIVGGVALTLELPGFRGLFTLSMLGWLLGHALMVVVAWAIGHLLGLAPVHMAGLVLLGASTPDLTAPLLSRISRSDTHTTMLLLVAAGLLSLLLIPVAAHFLIDPTLRVPLGGLLTVLLIGILLPFLLALTAQAAAPRAFTHLHEYTTGVSTLATILITALVAAMNRDLLLHALDSVPLVRLATASFMLLAIGLLLGRLLAPGTRALRDAGLFIPGTREYALAAALVLSAGFPPEAAVLPLIFGAIQMVIAPLLAHRLKRGKVAAPTR